MIGSEPQTHANTYHTCNTYHIYHSYHIYQIAQTDNRYIPTMPCPWPISPGHVQVELKACYTELSGAAH